MKKLYYVFSVFTIFVLSLLYLLHQQTTVAQHQRNLNACMKKFEIIRDRSTRIEPVKLYPFKKRHLKFGYRDSRGNVVIQPQFAQANFFSNGRAQVTDRLWYTGFINQRGELVIPHKFVTVSDFIDGLAVFSGTKDDSEKRGAIDLNGNIVLEFHNAHPTMELYNGFQNGRTKVFIYEHEELPWGLFKIYGNPVSKIYGYVDCTGAVTWER